MQKRDFETYQKRFRDFEILPKFSETHVFRGTIRHRSPPRIPRSPPLPRRDYMVPENSTVELRYKRSATVPENVRYSWVFVIANCLVNSKNIHYSGVN